MALREISVEDLVIKVREDTSGRERKMTLLAQFKATTPGRPTDDWNVTIQDMTVTELQRLLQMLMESVTMDEELRELGAEKDYDVVLGRRRP